MDHLTKTQTKHTEIVQNSEGVLLANYLQLYVNELHILSHAEEFVRLPVFNSTGDWASRNWTYLKSDIIANWDSTYKDSLEYIPRDNTGSLI